MKRLLLLMLLVGCGDRSESFSLKEPMNWVNDPRGVPGGEGALSTTVGAIPSSGASSRKVWTGSWLPFSQGGSLTATAKYDQATGSQATYWEQSEVSRMSYLSWGGHCNGLAAASTMEEEPLRPVYYNGVWFGVDDIKALLTEAWNGGGTIVGGRCNNERVSRDADGRIVEGDCRDLNPATMHIVLGNFLGRWHKPVIMDTDAGSQVWNFPVVSYRTLQTQALSRADANNWLRGVYADGYPYNAAAVSMQYVQLEVTYSNGSIWILEYILELDSAGTIIGGEWFRDSRDAHPDFIWRHTAPVLSNPYLNVDTIYTIYRSSRVG